MAVDLRKERSALVRRPDREIAPRPDPRDQDVPRDLRLVREDLVPGPFERRARERVAPGERLVALLTRRVVDAIEDRGDLRRPRRLAAVPEHRQPAAGTKHPCDL